MAPRQRRLAIKRVAAVIAVTAALAACGSDRHAGRAAAQGNAVLAGPTATVADITPEVRDATQFGLPVSTDDVASVVVLSTETFRPRHPLRGREGTPLLVNAFDAAPREQQHVITGVTVADPTTGRSCVPRPDLLVGPSTFVTQGSIAAEHQGQSVLRSTAHRIAFVCPEIVRANLLVTVWSGFEPHRFYGPLS